MAALIAAAMQIGSARSIEFFRQEMKIIRKREFLLVIFKALTQEKQGPGGAFQQDLGIGHLTRPGDVPTGYIIRRLIFSAVRQA